jgi:hypothetical protein
MPDQAVATIIPASPEVLSLRVPDSPLVAQAKALQIKTDEDVITAKDIRSQLKARITFVMDDPTGPKFTENISGAHKLHKSLVAAAKVFTDPCNDAIGIIDTNIGKFDQEKRRLKELADRQAKEDQQAAQKKIMDAATAKINKALASTGRIEQQIIDMQEIVNNPESSETEIELASRQIEVLRMKLDSHTEKASQIQKIAEQAADALPVASPAAVSFTKTTGVKTKKIGTVLDKMGLIKLIAEGKAPDGLVDINEGMLNKLINIGVTFPADIISVREESKYGGRG